MSGDLTEALMHAIQSGTVLDFGGVIGRAIAETPPSRDQLAAMAMPALIEGSDPVGDDKDLELLARIVAKQSYAFADAMLAERAAPLVLTPASTAVLAAVEVMRGAAERIFNGTADQGTSEELTDAASSLEKGA